MPITKDDIQKALRIKRCVNECFGYHNVSKVQAKELMPDFIKSGIFNANHQDGLPIRDFLRKLDEENHLHLIPQLHAERNGAITNWYFIQK
ncbi:hypothetical protein ES705_07962 [subsurface metagenome]